ncbi:MAG: WXG100 family type VII secretion target [Synergistaceae bacterium]|nr:WXG100 family type VII secretion target [Synergistaceae bacterium]MBQ6737344.1 WXG100 family type VII secretion target [Synergistaceae bacterium]MBQ7068838.1 WXG100 family type VII secretion target [Synergistaceae bacterium]MBR0075436.1 WXG100 family type VII secretion target [Synergistaceae bacterium]MBR0079103.1 WXG100 family type VII secretion target [Synergistaceae bacterium]
MPEILLTPELLRSEAGKLGTERTNLDEAVNKIKSLVDSLESGWHGKAQQAFVNSFREKETVYRKFSEDMGAFQAFMQGYASSMEASDSNAPSGLNF